jgi:hypothetical protein
MYGRAESKMRVDLAEFGQLELDQQVDPCLEDVGAIQGQGKAKLGVDDSSKAPVLTLGVSADLLHEFGRFKALARMALS